VVLFTSHSRYAKRVNEKILDKFHRVRKRTEALAKPLTKEDHVVQSMPDASPTKWHLAHTSWFFETFVLKAKNPEYQTRHPQYESLFNSYYNGVGVPFPRHLRGTISRPTTQSVYDYRAEIDEAIDTFLRAQKIEDEDVEYTQSALARLVNLGLHHEQQHQELLLTDIKHALGTNPMRPAYLEKELPKAKAAQKTSTLMSKGVIEIGHSRHASAFGFDNETPRHHEYVADYKVHNQLVTNGDFRAFIDAKGYDTPSLWLDDGWRFIQEQNIRAPLYWRAHDGTFSTYTLHGEKELDEHAPLCHVSFFEADAYARFMGKRLPNEFEWEHCAQTVMHTPSTLQDDDCFHPCGQRPHDNEHAPSYLLGQVWEWTRSAYAPYRGFKPLEGTLGEYNGKFMNGQNVLRGGSVATPSDHLRITYRNFFAPEKRWQFVGVRLAEDA